MSTELDYGCLVTGVVEQDVTTGHFVLRVEGESDPFDIQAFLQRYKDQEIRVTMVTTETIAQIEAILNTDPNDTN